MRVRRILGLALVVGVTGFRLLLDRSASLQVRALAGRMALTVAVANPNSPWLTRGLACSSLRSASVRSRSGVPPVGADANGDPELRWCAARLR